MSGSSHGRPRPFSGYVKSFDAERGFGFVTCGAERDIFLHVSVLKGRDFDRPSPGDVMTGLAMDGDRGSYVSWVETLRLSDRDANAAVRRNGTVKFYDAAKGFGFLSSGSALPAFIGAKTLRKSGIDSLRSKQSVTFTLTPGSQGLVVETLALVDPVSS